MLGTEHGRFEEAHERFGRELPGPVVDQRVEKAPEENERHDVEDVLTPQLLEGLRTAGVEKERTADHHEHGDTPSRHAVVCVYDVPVEAGNVKLVPIRTGDVEQDNRAYRDDAQSVQVVIPLGQGWVLQSSLPYAREVLDEVFEERTRRFLLDAAWRKFEVNRPREGVICQRQDDDVVAVDRDPSCARARIRRPSPSLSSFGPRPDCRSRT